MMKKIEAATSLMLDKNHDYDEAWREMRVSSFTDIILQKLLRTKEIESNNGHTVVSEGVDANYMDMMRNYAIFRNHQAPNRTVTAPQVIPRLTQWVTWIIRVLVGRCLHIFQDFVKAVDPWGYTL